MRSLALRVTAIAAWIASMSALGVASCSSGSPSPGASRDASTDAPGASGDAPGPSSDAGPTPTSDAASGVCARTLRLDTTYGQGGVLPLGPLGYTGATALTLLTDGSIIVGGARPMQKLAVGGSLDATFQGDTRLGDAAPQEGTGVIAAAPQGGFFAALPSSASTTVTITRLDGDGTLDTSFGVGGSTTLPVPSDGDAAAAIFTAAALTGDGQGGVYVEGLIDQMDVYLAHVDASGVFDASFAGGQGYLQLPSTLYLIPIGLAVRPDGKIAVGIFAEDANVGAPSVEFSFVVLSDSSGNLDPSYGGDAGVVAPQIENYGRLSGLPNGDLLVGGGERVAKILASGAVDMAFGGGSGTLFSSPAGFDGYGLRVTAGTNGTFAMPGMGHAANPSAPAVLRYDLEGNPCGAAVQLSAPGTESDNVVIESDGTVYVAGHGMSDGGPDSRWIARLLP